MNPERGSRPIEEENNEPDYVFENAMIVSHPEQGGSWTLEGPDGEDLLAPIDGQIRFFVDADGRQLHPDDEKNLEFQTASRVELRKARGQDHIFIAHAIIAEDSNERETEPMLVG
jgi:hypothetical protein